ncbi:hypothetical protein FJZ48_04305 [Candidatus Uhrbacteria bacterium]|nr:hypothetical protein [Candidatus Uhrbacteria bacterium]
MSRIFVYLFCLAAINTFFIPVSSAQTVSCKDGGDCKPGQLCENKVCVTPSSVSNPKDKVLPGRYGYKDPLGGVDIPRLIGGVIRFSLGIVGSIFLLMFVYGGFLWMTGGGEAKRVGKAKDTLKNAVLGMAIIMLSYTLVTFVLEIGTRLQK